MAVEHRFQVDNVDAFSSGFKMSTGKILIEDDEIAVAGANLELSASTVKGNYLQLTNRFPGKTWILLIINMTDNILLPEQ